MRAIATTTTLAIAATVAGLAGTVSAQLDPSLVTGLSANCASGLVGIVTTSNISSCLALPSAVGALTSAANTSSVLPGLSNYLNNNICGASKSPCTKDQLSAANSSLLQSCATDLGANGGQNIPALVYYFINSYDRLRTAACLQDSTGTSCLVKDMETLQDTTRMNLTFSAIQNVLSNQTIQQQSLMALSANKTAFCTDCTHGLYSVLFPNNSNQQLAGALGQTCNTTFLDGKIPATLKSTANGNSTTTTSSATANGGKNAASPVNIAAIASVGSLVAALAAGLALL
ncbi:uncharacterized protein UTRI_02920 [Ustilago trichophora]|uniref:Uncharacterized protein n=1 Tax=Ustilago trichophora TaxID=86804 RepID=A0A5C3EP76_9BASI|nr:uncharacterized protein UTRI_02920 [Ustilago trichophora]